MRPIPVTTGELDTVLQSHTTRVVPPGEWPAPIQKIPRVTQLWAWPLPTSAGTVRSDGTTFGGAVGVIQTIRETTQGSPAWKVDRWYYRIIAGRVYRLGPFKEGLPHYTDHLPGWPLRG